MTTPWCSPSRRLTPTDESATSSKRSAPSLGGNRRKGLTIQTIMTAMHRARLCTTQAAISIPPVIPGQDLNADSGSGSGGGASAASAAASEEEESEFAPLDEPAPEGDAGGDGMAIDTQEVPIDDASMKIREGFVKLSTKPGERKHLVVVGVGLESQFGKATRQVPNEEYLPVIFEHSDGFERIVSLLTKHDPHHAGEVVYVIGDPEMEPVRVLPVMSRADRIKALWARS